MSTSVSDADFQSEVLDSKELVLVDFWAEWCTPCKILNPIVDEIAAEMQGKVKVLSMDVDENPQTAGQYQVMSIPTIKLFKDGQIVENFVGVQPKENYVDAINRHQ